MTIGNSDLMDVEPSVQELHAGIEETLTAPLDARWKEVLRQWEEAPPSMRERVEEELHDLRDRVLEALLEIESKNDLQRGVAFQYVAVKGHWATLLAQIPSRAENQQDTERLICRASGVSLLVERLESLLCWEALGGTTIFLNTPLRARVGSSSMEGSFRGGPPDES